MTLTGTVTGTNQKALLAKATELAEAYYDTKCVSVTLGDARPNTDDYYDLMSPAAQQFDADFEAVEYHPTNARLGYDTRMYPCTQCGLKGEERDKA